MHHSSLWGGLLLLAVAGRIRTMATSGTMSAIPTLAGAGPGGSSMSGSLGSNTMTPHEIEEREARTLRWTQEGTQPEATRSKPRVLVLHGAGMSMRGKVQVERYGPLTLADYERHIVRYADELRLDVEFFGSNSEGALIDRLYAAHDAGDVHAAILNPGGFTKGYRALGLACGQVGFPVVEVHISNPAVNGTTSEITPHCHATVQGFGIEGYRLALSGIADHLLHAPAKK